VIVCFLFVVVLGCATKPRVEERGLLQETADTSSGTWVRLSNTCSVKTPITEGAEFAEVKWTGICVHGLAEGQGVLTWDYGTDKRGVYRGQVRAGKLEGRGKYVLASGTECVGSFHSGLLHGYAECKNTGVLFYKGKFKAGRFDGHGLYRGQNGSTYNGEFSKGELNGQGVYIRASGARYEGVSKDGVPHGVGRFSLPNGDYYDGEWRDGLAHGEGKASIEGEIYAGVWGNGCFSDGDLLAAWDVEPAKCGF